MDKPKLQFQEIAKKKNQTEFYKCGEVFVAGDGRFRWNCVLCGKEFQNAYFLQHVLCNHISSRCNENPKTRKIIEIDCSLNFVRSSSSLPLSHTKHKFCYNESKENTLLLKKFNIKKDVRIHLEKNSFLEYMLAQKRIAEGETESVLNEIIRRDTLEDCNQSIQKKEIFDQTNVISNVDHKPSCIKRRTDFNQEYIPFSESVEIKKTALIDHSEFIRKNLICDKNLGNFKHPVNIVKDDIMLNFEKFSKHQDNLKSSKIINARKYEKHVCEICGKESTTKYNLNNHIKLKHSLKDRKKYSCDRCTKVFVKEQSLENHMKIFHLKEKPFICDIDKCGRGFIDEKSLKNHQAFHTNERKFTCPKCGKKYLHKSKLDAHFKIYHVLGRIHQCKECNKSFYDPYTLRSHMICHTGEKPFACDECPAKFPRENALQWHKKVHSGIKDHICQICGRAYHLFTGLYAHMKTHGIKYNKKIEKGLISIEKIVSNNIKQSKVKSKYNNLEYKNVHTLK
ncbi:zinc finger protein 91-like [Condylostylus longicornis]|uniref:zinc finger protein 91-like n=1 Tax=Condylostylus longicornis TaxID=2530218 RepID=UPI00244E1D18|nr:zinc finger protein 91-like [Condylostylus longicornis]